MAGAFYIESKGEELARTRSTRRREQEESSQIVTLVTNRGFHSGIVKERERLSLNKDTVKKKNEKA